MKVNFKVSADAQRVSFPVSIGTSTPGVAITIDVTIWAYDVAKMYYEINQARKAIGKGEWSQKGGLQP